MCSLTDWRALRESAGRVGIDDEPWDDLMAERMAARSLFGEIVVDPGVSWTFSMTSG
jgi:hypothetical protein